MQLNAAYKKRCPTMDASATMQTTRSIQIIKSFPSETSILLGRMQGIVPVKKTISPIASTPTTKRDTMEVCTGSNDHGSDRFCYSDCGSLGDCHLVRNHGQLGQWIKQPGDVVEDISKIDQKQGDGTRRHHQRQQIHYGDHTAFEVAP